MHFQGLRLLVALTVLVLTLKWLPPSIASTPSHDVELDTRSPHHDLSKHTEAAANSKLTHLSRRQQDQSPQPNVGSSLLRLGWGIHPSSSKYLPACLKVTHTKYTAAGTPGYLKVFASMSYKEAREALGVSGTLSLKQIFTGTVKFAKEMSSHLLSDTFTTVSYIPIKAEQIDVEKSNTLTAYGQKYLLDATESKEKCGDRVLFSRDLGAIAMVTYRVNYESLEDKFSVGASITGKFRVVDLTASINIALSNNRSSLTAKVTAYQIGGNVAAINKVIDADAFAKCDGKNKDACDKAYLAVADYLSSPEFKQGIEKSPVPLKYYSLSYDALLQGSGGNAFKAEIDNALARIENVNDRIVQTQGALETFLSFARTPSKQEKIINITQLVNGNTLKVIPAIEACVTKLQPFDRNSVKSCSAAVTAMETSVYFPPDTFFGSGFVYQTFNDALEKLGGLQNPVYAKPIGLPQAITETNWVAGGSSISRDLLPYRWPFSSGSSLYYNPDKDAIFVVGGQIEEAYAMALTEKDGGLSVGLPIGNIVKEKLTTNREVDVQRFELKDKAGRLIAMTTYFVEKPAQSGEAILTQVSGVCALTYVFWNEGKGVLGMPIRLAITASFNDVEVTMCDFENGVIIVYDSAETQASRTRPPLTDRRGHVLYGPVLDYFRSSQNGGIAGRLGLPTSSVRVKGNFVYASFEYGTLVHDKFTGSDRIIQGELDDYVALESYLTSKADMKIQTLPSQFTLAMYGKIAMRVTPPSPLELPTFAISGRLYQEWQNREPYVGTPVLLYNTKTTFQVLQCERGAIVIDQQSRNSVFTLTGHVFRYWMDEGGIEGPFGLPSTVIRSSGFDGSFSNRYLFQGPFGYSLVYSGKRNPSAHEDSPPADPVLRFCPKDAVEVANIFRLNCLPMNVIIYPNAAHMYRIARKADKGDVATLRRQQMMVAWYDGVPSFLWKDVDGTPYVWKVNSSSVQIVDQAASRKSPTPYSRIRRLYRSSLISRDTDVRAYRTPIESLFGSGAYGTLGLAEVPASSQKPGQSKRMIPTLHYSLQRFKFSTRTIFGSRILGLPIWYFFGLFGFREVLSKLDAIGSVYGRVQAPMPSFDQPSTRYSLSTISMDNRREVTDNISSMRDISLSYMTIPLPHAITLNSMRDARIDELQEGEAAFFMREVDSGKVAVPAMAWKIDNKFYTEDLIPEQESK